MSALAEKEKAARPATVQVMRNRIEQALLDHFAAIEASLPGGRSVRRLRKEAIGAFAATGLPHRRIEEWKYTDLRNLLKEAYPPAAQAPLAAKAAEINAALGSLAGHDAHRITFVDGRFERPLSSLKSLPAGVHFRPLAEALAGDWDWLVERIAAETGRGAVAALNTAFMTDGATLRLDDGIRLDKPVLLVFARTSPHPQSAAVRNYIKFGCGCRGTLVEAHVALAGAGDGGQVNTLTSIDIGAEAAVTHVKLVDERAAAQHLSSWQGRVGAGCTYRPFQMTAGVGLARNDIAVTFAGQGAKLDLSGAFLGRGTSHIDTTLVVDHAVAGCESRELFKGVLDAAARGIFQGKIIVRPDAQMTDGKQMAQALLLSPDAEFDSKPELEIYADDVACGHGSTSAEIDEDLLFYCRSRGIPLDEAQALLVESFIGEAIGRVENEAVREALAAVATTWLKQGRSAIGAMEGAR